MNCKNQIPRQRRHRVRGFCGSGRYGGAEPCPAAGGVSFGANTRSPRHTQQRSLRLILFQTLIWIFPAAFCVCVNAPFLTHELFSARKTNVR